MYLIAYALPYIFYTNTKYFKNKFAFQNISKTDFWPRSVDQLFDRSYVRPSRSTKQSTYPLERGLCMLCTSVGRPTGRPLAPAVDLSVD